VRRSSFLEMENGLFGLLKKFKNYRDINVPTTDTGALVEKTVA